MHLGLIFGGLDRPLQLDCETVNAKIHENFQSFCQRFVMLFLSAMKTVIFAFTVLQSGWIVHFLVNFETFSGALDDHFYTVLAAIGAFLRAIALP